MPDKLPAPRCPMARPVEGATIADGGCVCKVMEEDAARADPIMEGAPIGIFVKASEDPHTYFGFCAGEGQPTTDPDAITNHYSACPVYAAFRDAKSAGLLGEKRTFEPERRPDPAEELARAEELGQLPEDREVRMFSAEELQWIA